jgi:hypothetical protein
MIPKIHDTMLSTLADCPFRFRQMYLAGVRRDEKDHTFAVGDLGHEFMRAALTGQALERLDKDGKDGPVILPFCADDLSIGNGRMEDYSPAALQLVNQIHRRNCWPGYDETDTAARNAAAGAMLLLAEVDGLEFMRDDQGIMVERKMDVEQGAVFAVLKECGASLDAADVATLSEHCGPFTFKADALFHSGAALQVADWKFTTKPIDAGAPALPFLTPQNLLYSILLRASGLRVDYASNVRVFAEQVLPPLTASEIPTNSDGTLSRRHRNTTAAAYREALAGLTKRIKVGAKRLAEYEEHIAKLEEIERSPARPRLVYEGGSVNYAQAADVTADRLRGLAIALRTNLATRNLRVYQYSRCTSRPAAPEHEGGQTRRRSPACEVQELCHGSLDGVDVVEQAGHLVSIGRYKRRETTANV